MDKPTGTVTFLFTDIEGSTKLAQKYPEALHIALDEHHEILQSSIESHEGFVFEIVGDAFCAAFVSAEDAFRAAVEAQLRLKQHKWNEAVIKVRIGIHTGPAEWNGERYMGYITLARAHRVMSAAYGEQILISDEARSCCTSGSEIPLANGVGISFDDLGERRLKDLIQPVRLFQVIAPGLRHDFPQLNTLDARPNNLPVQLTSYIGMNNVIAEARSYLDKTNLLTLLGAGGSGKTRLALQLGAELIDRYANGVFIAELDVVSEESLITQSVMNSLSVKEEQGKTPVQTLNDFLKGKELLLILDNCEHVIGGAAMLAELLLKNHPKLRIIATSRETLNCNGELKFKVPTLPVPEQGMHFSPEELARFDSVRLFIERALAVNPSFRVNDKNAPSLAEICRRLDGIPLAIELAAARTKVMSIEKIHERLDDRFSLLTGGKRTALPRQQTLRALIDWSYELLKEDEKIMWGRLSVFAGGFELDAVEKICCDEELDESQLLDILHSLADKSIITYDESNDRFRMLDIIRQYGHDKLKEAEEFEQIANRHLNYYLELSESLESKLIGSDAQSLIPKIKCELGNIESALNTASRSIEDNRGLRLSSSMGVFWKIRSQFSEGKMWLETFLNNSTYVPVELLAKAKLRLGVLKGFEGEFEKSIELCNSACDIFNELGNIPELIEAMSNIAMMKFELGDYESSRKIYEECHELVGADGDKGRIAYLLNDHGSSLMETGNYREAAQMFEESVSMQRKSGDLRGVAYSLYNLGNVKLELANFQEARKVFDESVSLFRELGDKRGESYALTSLGNAELHNGSLEMSAVLIGNSIEISRSIGDKRSLSYSLCCLAEARLQLEGPDPALELLEESLKISQENDIRPVTAYSLLGIGNAKFAKGEVEAAKASFEESLQLSRELGHRPGVAFNLNGLASVAMKKNEFDTAHRLLTESLSLNRETDQKKEIITNLLGLAEIHSKRNDYASSGRITGYIHGFCELNHIVPDKNTNCRLDELRDKLSDSIGKEELQCIVTEGLSLSADEIDRIANAG